MRFVRPGRANRREFGVTVVEGAIIAPVFFALLFGIVEAGLTFSARSSVGDAVASAARSASISGNDADSDFQALQQVMSHMPSDGSGLRYVVVYKAADLLQRRPTTDCVDDAESGGSGVLGKCNVYQRSTVLAPAPAMFGYDAVTAQTATADMKWPARSRAVSYTGGRDIVGVYISSTYKGISGVIKTHLWNVGSVLELEGKSV